jgi:hypothetical protein
VGYTCAHAVEADGSLNLKGNILGLDTRRIFHSTAMHTNFEVIGNGYGRSSDVLTNLYIGVKIPTIT